MVNDDLKIPFPVHGRALTQTNVDIGFHAERKKKNIFSIQTIANTKDGMNDCLVRLSQLCSLKKLEHFF